MNNPQVYPLASIDFSGTSGAPLTAVPGLEGALSVTLEFNFKWGSSGTPTGNVKVQTTLDGQTWSTVARVDLAQASFVKHCNLEFLLSKGITTYNDLSAEGVYDGVLGNQLRVVPSWSGGSYSGSTLAVNANVR